jgi:polyferredoxin
MALPLPLHPSQAPPPPRPADLLRWPVLGRFLRWRHARTSLQLVLLAAAAVVVLHGLLGPSLAPRNVATVATWVHYRGLLVLALLAAGNLFCTGCPFVLVRDAGRRLHAPARRWPRRLRTKWIGLGLLVAVLFAYELLDLWASPRGTVWLLLAYFGLALAIDVTFAGASFCKYLCPIGQYNFVASTLSPLEVQIRSRETCGSCRTHDCIRGRRAAEEPRRVTQRGCELALFLPGKVGNLDCTLCLDCIHACPHDNVALAVRTPGAELWDDRRRSGIGLLNRRADIAAVAVVFTFAALLNAFGMTGPVYALEEWIARVTGLRSEAPILALVFLAALVALPAALLAISAALSRGLSGEPSPLKSVVVRYAYALVPLGFGVWLAHYGFHFLTGALTIVPVGQSAAADLFGWPVLGSPWWGWAGMTPGSVYPIEMGFVFLGTVASLAVAYRISLRDHPHRAFRVTAPWAALVASLAAAAVWVLSQPMEMRGTFPG